MEARVYSPRKSPASTLFQTRAIKPSPEKRLAIKSVQISPKNPKKRAASSEDETGLTPRKRLFPHTKADPAL
ncbi:MAG: hypothetical protein M1830_000786, partial [Pleopsidium flavum]